MTEYMSVAEFRAKGYLQELNRQFLHPLGLALETVIHEDGTESLGGVWDSREDPEGFLFGDLSTTDAQAKAMFVENEWNTRRMERVRRLGYMVQEVGPNERKLK